VLAWVKYPLRSTVIACMSSVAPTNCGGRVAKFCVISNRNLVGK